MHRPKKLSLWLFFNAMIFAFGAIEVRSEVRKFAFAEGYPSGKLSLISTVGVGPASTPAATARGKLSINVKPGQILMLDLNPHCLEHPEMLATMPTDGIDQLRMSYMSMDDDVHVCDKALGALPLFKKPLILDCIRTDATDAGLRNFKSLPMVKRLNCFLSIVDGSFLKESQLLQNLQHLNISHNALKAENLIAVSQLKNLRYLDIRETNLTDAGLREVCKNTNLKFLGIDANPRVTDGGLECLAQIQGLENLSMSYDKNITDKSIDTIQKLSHLNRLDLRHTKISLAALDKLKVLKLKEILLPEHYWEVEMAKLRKNFPSTLFKFPSAEVPKETQIQFAPMK